MSVYLKSIINGKLKLKKISGVPVGWFSTRIEL